LFAAAVVRHRVSIPVSSEPRKIPWDDELVSAADHLSGEQFSYRMQHQGADPDSGEALHEVGTRGVYPPDVHQHPDWYGAEHAETIAQLHSARGRPDRTVTIYRSLPAPHREINPGDWVATAADYARAHGREQHPADDWPVVKARVPASTVRSPGDSLEEWSYHGPAIPRPALHYRGGRNQRAASRSTPVDLTKTAPPPARVDPDDPGVRIRANTVARLTVRVRP
jgi:hypothetical protein